MKFNKDELTILISALNNYKYSLESNEELSINLLVMKLVNLLKQDTHYDQLVDLINSYEKAVW